MDAKDVGELYSGCRTYRRFQQRPVSEALLRKMVRNARKRSCAMNAQILRYIVVSRPDMVARMQPLLRWAAALPKDIGTPKVGEQPTAFIAVLKTGQSSAYSDIDAGIALDTMALTAWEAGVGSCILANIDRSGIRDLLEIPEDQELRVVLALGYPAHRSQTVEVPENGNLKYYVDKRRDYFVPKYKLEDVAKFI